MCDMCRVTCDVRYASYKTNHIGLHRGVSIDKHYRSMHIKYHLCMHTKYCLCDTHDYILHQCLELQCIGIATHCCFRHVAVQSCMRFDSFAVLLHVTRHTSHVTRHTSHIKSFAFHFPNSTCATADADAPPPSPAPSHRVERNMV